jgi:rRNA maturation RNase YbeY
LRLLRRITRALLHEARPHGAFDLAIYLVAEPEMTRLNETHLRHKGPTDVITFDYAEKAEDCQLPIAKACSVFRVACSAPDSQQATRNTQHATRSPLLHGEIFVCLDEAVSQARRFHATWQSELVRYIVHGVLHLLGYDDAASRPRRKMKAAEDTLVRQLARQFDFYNLGLLP